MSTTKIITTVGKNKQEHVIDNGPRNFTCIVHQQGIRVDIPSHVEINSKNTLECVEKLNQTQWKWISEGDIFRVIWTLMFQDTDVTIPETIEELVSADFGMQHAAGMIILGCEAMFAGQHVFFRNPENHMHPAVERCIVYAFKAMMRLCGKTGTVTAKPKGKGKGKKTKSDELSDSFDEQLTSSDSYIDEAIKKAVETVNKKKPKEQTVDEQDWQITQQWLQAKAAEKGEDAPFAKIGDHTLSIKEVINEVAVRSDIGKEVRTLYFSAFKLKQVNNE